MHSFRNEFFTYLFKIQNVQVIQNDVIKCCKMMSSNVAKWCHHIATSQQRGEIVFHVFIFLFFLEFIFDKLVLLDEDYEKTRMTILAKEQLVLCFKDALQTTIQRD